MNERYLEDLRELSRHMPLEQAVHVVCRPFATLTSIDIARDGDKGYICFVTLASSDERAALLSTVGGFLFGDGLCFFLPWPLDENVRRGSGEQCALRTLSAVGRRPRPLPPYSARVAHLSVLAASAGSRFSRGGKRSVTPRQ